VGSDFKDRLPKIPGVYKDGFIRTDFYVARPKKIFFVACPFFWTKICCPSLYMPGTAVPPKKYDCSQGRIKGRAIKRPENTNKLSPVLSCSRIGRPSFYTPLTVNLLKNYFVIIDRL